MIVCEMCVMAFRNSMCLLLGGSYMWRERKTSGAGKGIVCTESEILNLTRDVTMQIHCDGSDSEVIL